MTVLFSNNATARLASGISAGATAFAVQTGQGSLFPLPGVNEYFYATLVDQANNIEIVKCTARTGDNLTVTRAQQGTSARAYQAGDICDLRLTAGALEDIQSLVDGAITTAKITDAAITTPKIADNAVTAAKIVNGAISAAKLAAGAALASLGFTPTKQGSANEVEFAWIEPNVRVRVDGIGQGNIAFFRADGAVDTAGYRGSPAVVKASSFTLDQSLVGKTAVATGAGMTAWVPQFSEVPFGEGAYVHIVNLSGGAISIGQGAGVSLVIAGTTTTGTRTLANNGRARVQRIIGNTWLIDGQGLT